MYPTVEEEWKLIHEDDLWAYNKLIIAKKLGHLCGPTGVPVPFSGDYIVRPVFNLLGMGRNARIEALKDSTDHLHPSEFWCEVFKGEHLSVDFYQKEPILVVRGIRDSKESLYKWKKWEKIQKDIKFPEILNNLKGNYDYINCEFIENKLIEVHFRQNPDFRYNNTIAIPVWDGENTLYESEYRYIIDEDYCRKGFFVD